MTTHRIHTQEGWVRRVRNGAVPVVDLPLSENQYIVSFELTPSILFTSDRVTTDWKWKVVIGTRMP